MSEGPEKEGPEGYCYGCGALKENFYNTRDGFIGQLVEIATSDPRAPLIGEADNVLQLLLMVLQYQSVEVRGESSGGKTTLVSRVLSVVPQKYWQKITGLSERVMNYLDTFPDLRILWIAERASLEGERETRSEQDVKLTMGGESLQYAVTVKDENGRAHAEIRATPIRMVITTSTEVAAKIETENRLNVLYVDDSREMTGRVVRSYLEGIASFDRFIKGPEYDDRICRGQEIMDLLMTKAPQEVIVPFGPALEPLFDSKPPTSRRNVVKVSKQVEGMARANAANRWIADVPDGRSVVVADPADLATILYSGRKYLEPMLTSTPDKERKTLQFVKEKLLPSNLPASIDTIIANDGESEIGSRRTIQEALKKLRRAGRLTAADPKKRPIVYEVASRVDDFMPLHSVAQVLRNAGELSRRWGEANGLGPFLREELLRAYPLEQEPGADTTGASNTGALQAVAPIPRSDEQARSAPAEEASDASSANLTKQRGARIITYPCSACGKQVGTYEESRYTKDKKAYCREYFPVKPVSKEDSR